MLCNKQKKKKNGLQEFEEERTIRRRRRSEEGSCDEASRSLSGWSVVTERVTCLSVGLWLQQLSHPPEEESESGGGGRHHTKRRERGGAPLHSPLSCLSPASHQQPPPALPGPAPLQPPGDAARGQLGSNGGQRGWGGSGWGQLQQRLDRSAHLDQAALLQDVVGQTQLVLRGERRRSRSAKHIYWVCFC